MPDRREGRGVTEVVSSASRTAAAVVVVVTSLLSSSSSSRTYRGETGHFLTPTPVLDHRWCRCVPRHTRESGVPRTIRTPKKKKKFVSFDLISSHKINGEKRRGRKERREERRDREEKGESWSSGSTERRKEERGGPLSPTDTFGTRREGEGEEERMKVYLNKEKICYL